LPQPLVLARRLERPSEVLRRLRQGERLALTTYLDSSAIVKLAVREPESLALRGYLRRREPFVSSALARTEVLRAAAGRRRDSGPGGRIVLRRLDLVRVNDRILNVAGALRFSELRSLDAIHLATANQLGEELLALLTFDNRMVTAAKPWLPDRSAALTVSDCQDGVKLR
jgi:predicted nucleic acid-binding protein